MHGGKVEVVDSPEGGLVVDVYGEEGGEGGGGVGGKLLLPRKVQFTDPGGEMGTHLWGIKTIYRKKKSIKSIEN